MLKYYIFIFLLFGFSLAHKKFVPKCGVTPYTPRSGRIAGGVLAKKSAWPWQVALKFNGSLLCAGTLIDKSWVLTAMHCVIFIGDNPADYTVDVGMTDLLTPDSWSKTDLKISKFIVHPSFNGTAKMGETLIDYDVLLLKLEKPITFDSSYRVNSVCLPKAKSNFVKRTGVATGWGYLNDFKNDTVESIRNLRQVSLTVLKDSDCRSYLNSVNITSSTLICAGAVNGGKGICGDSGAPFVVNDDNSYKLIGVTSFGAKCGDTSFFTKVSSILPWIKSTINSN